MIIDGHSHLTFPVEKHIAEMDAAGVNKTVLFSTSFHPETATSTQEVEKSMMYLNDLVAGKKGSMTKIRQNSIMELTKAIRAYPSRYIGFGSVPIHLSYEETRIYVNDYIVKNQLSGMGEFTCASGQIHLLESIFRISEEFGHLPIWIHAFFPLTISDIRQISQMSENHPHTPVILGHLGGTNWLEAMHLVKEISNLYLDTSAYYSTFVLGVVINELPEKCIFGVDGPFGDLQLSIDAILKVAKSSQIANAVLGDNIQKILNI